MFKVISLFSFNDDISAEEGILYFVPINPGYTGYTFGGGVNYFPPAILIKTLPQDKGNK